MSEFKLPKGMAVASVWVVWLCLAIGSVGWAFFVVLQHFGVAGDAADWVQAFGSILAIVGAGSFPIWHEHYKSRREARRLRELILELAQDQLAKLRHLSRAMSEALNDFGEHSLNPYFEQGHHLRWKAHIEAVQAIPLVSLMPGEVIDVGHLKGAAACAGALCMVLHEITVFDDRYVLELGLLNSHIATAMLLVEAYQS